MVRMVRIKTGADIMMRFCESETTELKSVVTNDIKKEIIAFANSGGGTVYIGVSDDGTVCGISDPDGSALQISNMLRDSVKPDITMFVHYETIIIDERSILAVFVQRGTNRPYYLTGKGLRPEGVYVRQGFSSVPASDSAIRTMIKESDSESFESMPCGKNDLTFDSVKIEFKKRNIEFGVSQMKTLKLMTNDSAFTNLGLLLSDECVQTLKTAVFEGIDRNVFKDRREFSGSVLKQMNDAFEFIDMHNHVRGEYDKLLRVDTRDYPVSAVREALLNCIVHRDYSFTTGTFINIFDDRMEFISLGGLMPGLEKSDIMMGISVCRNPNLANVFYRLRLIEAYGTGIQKIMSAYSSESVSPSIETSNNAFKVVLPNVNYNKNNEKNTDSNELFENKLIEYAKENGCITRRNIQDLLNVGQSTAIRIIKKLTERGVFIKTGGGRTVKYKIK